MKKMNLCDTDKILPGNWSVIESENDDLKNICSSQQTRHGLLRGFLNNSITALIAYQTFDKKPSIKIEHELADNKVLLITA
jgi:hypothetical protein